MVYTLKEIRELDSILGLDDQFIYIHDAKKLPKKKPYSRWRHPCGNCGRPTKVGWAGTVCHRRGCTTWATNNHKKIPESTKRWRRHHWNIQVEYNKLKVDLSQYQTKDDSKYPPDLWRHPCVNCWNPCIISYDGVTCKSCGGDSKKWKDRPSLRVMHYRIATWKKFQSLSSQ